MKSVKSMADLTRLALESGAKVQLEDGRTINADGVRERVPPKVAAAPAPQTPALLQPAPDPALAEANERLAKALQHALSMLQQPQANPTAWEFTVERDRSGLMTKIVATPVAAVTH